MPPRTLSLRPFAAGVLLLASAAAASAQLASNSPFLPPQTTAAPAATANAALEYRGYVSTPEGTLYRVHDPARKIGVFLKLNERDENFGVVLKSHDASHNTLTVEHQGRTVTLQEREGKIVSSGNAASMPPPMPQQQPGPIVAPAVTQSVVVNPTPADEQRRLEAVAAEVARRRALREQAQQQMNQTGQVNVAPVVAQPQQQQQQRNNFQPTPQGNYQQPAQGNGNQRNNRQNKQQQQR